MLHPENATPLPTVEDLPSNDTPTEVGMVDVPYALQVRMSDGKVTVSRNAVGVELSPMEAANLAGSLIRMLPLSTAAKVAANAASIVANKLA